MRSSHKVSAAAVLATLTLAATPVVTQAAGDADWVMRQLEQTDGYDFRSGSSSDQSYQSMGTSDNASAAAAPASEATRQERTLGAAPSTAGRSGAPDGSSRAGTY